MEANRVKSPRCEASVRHVIPSGAFLRGAFLLYNMGSVNDGMGVWPAFRASGR